MELQLDYDGITDGTTMAIRWRILYCRHSAAARLPKRAQNSEHKKARIRRRALS